MLAASWDQSWLQGFLYTNGANDQVCGLPDDGASSSGPRHLIQLAQSPDTPIPV